MLDYDWDVCEYRLPHADALALLRQPPTSRQVERTRKHLLDLFGPRMVTEQLGLHIYRAGLSFGLLTEAAYNPICHQEQNNFLNLCDLSFSIDLVEISDPQEPGIYQVGWMDFSVHGPGYLFPWTYEETLAKLRAHPDLGRICDICREMWPATPAPPEPDIIARRPQMGKLWAEPVDAPYDWYWAIDESY